MTNVDHIPEYAEPLVGYRIWRVRQQPVDDPSYAARKWDGFPRPQVLRLTAMYGVQDVGTTWPAYRRFEATHEPRSGMWPHLTSEALQQCQGTPCNNSATGYGCGIYAQQSIHMLERDWCQLLTSMFLYGPLVIGAVYLWGRVTIHQYGYRAQYGYPAYLLGAYDCDGAAVAKEYGIEFREEDKWKLENQSERPSWNPWLSPSQFVNVQLKSRQIGLSGLSNLRRYLITYPPVVLAPPSPFDIPLPSDPVVIATCSDGDLDCPWQQDKTAYEAAGLIAPPCQAKVCRRLSFAQQRTLDPAVLYQPSHHDDVIDAYRRLPRPQGVVKAIRLVTVRMGIVGKDITA